MNIKAYIGIWIFVVVVGIFYITQTGVSYSSITCLTGEVARTKGLCPECNTDLHCAQKGSDFVCDMDEKKCVRKSCFSAADCSVDNICEFNKCIPEMDLYEKIVDV